MSEEERLLDKAFGILAGLVHKDYSAGPDGFKIFKNDLYKHMAKARSEALKPHKPMPKNFPKFG